MGKRKIKLIALFSILLCWVSLVYAFSSGPPPSNTGAPGESSCSSCHRGSNPTGSVRIEGLPQAYVAGTRYNLTVTVSETGKQRWGFQITAIRDDGSAAGTFMITDSSMTQMASGSPGGRSRMYIQHSPNGTQRGKRDTASFRFDWVAPTSDVGRITFYVAGNAANNDGSSGNDNIYLANVAIMAGSATPAPTLTSINPISGPAAGGTEITLTGSNFVTGAMVTIDTIRVNSTFDNARNLRVVTPPHAPGTVDITVTNPDGQVARLRNSFTYEAAQLPAPSISNISPNMGSTSGGTMVTIMGTNFRAGASVVVGSRQATMINISETQITAITQPNNPGTVNVVVTNPDGQVSTLPGGFTFVGEPVGAMVQLLSPNGGEVLSSGGAPFTINWMVMSGASATQRLELSTDGGQTFSTMIMDNLDATETSFEFAVPPAINTTNARIRISVIENGAVTSDTSDANFRILPAPTITNVAPTVTSSIKLKITGTMFQSGAVIEVNGAAIPSTKFKSATSLIGKKVDRNLAGQQIKVRVRNPDGTISLERLVTP